MRNFTVIVAEAVMRALGNAAASRLGAFRSWPASALLIDRPLALAEEKTSRLRGIYAKASRDIWDGPALFREAVNKHGGIQLSEEKRRALAVPITMLMWGELAAWIVSAELAERLEDPDARMAASSQVFDEARHFYTLRDYLALLHVPVPPLNPFAAIAFRRLLATRDLTKKLVTMQLLAEGAATAIFRFLLDSRIEPVLSELLPYIERDEARHVGLGVLSLPERLDQLTVKQRHKVRKFSAGVGDLLAVAQFQMAEHYRILGADPRDLIRTADRVLFNLSEKLGTVPGSDEKYFRADDPSRPDYNERLDFFLPLPGQKVSAGARGIRMIIEIFGRALPA